MECLSYEQQLRQRILEYENNIHGLAEVYNKILEKQSTNKSATAFHLSALINYTKLQVLLELYNQNFYDEEMRELENVVNENLKSEEERLECLF